METTDLQQINQWIYGVLISDDLLKEFVGVNPNTNNPQFYRGKAPQSATFPYIEYRYLTGAPKRGGDNKRIFGRPKYQIKIIQQGDSEDCYESEAYPAYARLRSLFYKNQMDGDTVVIGCSIYNELTYYDANSGGQLQAHMLYQLEFFSYN